MENNYGVGVANRYALFLEEGENSLTAIKKKLSKKLRLQQKLDRKENAEARKVETTKEIEKPKPPADHIVAEVSPPPSKDFKDTKNELTPVKEKKTSDANSNREKESQEKIRYPKNGEASVVENDQFDNDTSNKPNDAFGNSRKVNFDNRKNPDKKYNNNEPNQFKSTQYKKFDKDDTTNKDGNDFDNTSDRYQFEDNLNVRENGHTSYNNDYKPRGGRFGRASRGSRNSYGGNDRRKDFEQSPENKEDFDTDKNEFFGEEKAQVSTENDECQKNEENKDNENDANLTDEQKEEVKEYLTLDEWKKLRGDRQKPQYNLRKAGEGEDLTQWKNMRELHKKKDDEFLKNDNNTNNNAVPGSNENEEDNAGIESVQRVARQKHIDINVHFRDAPVRGRGGRVVRSGRFGYRGGNVNFGERSENFSGEPRQFRKTRGGPVGRGASRQNAPKITDEHDFPSLG